MNIKYDKNIDAKYISVKNGKVYKTDIIKKWLNIDIDRDGNVLGVEILNASKNLISMQIDNERNLQILEINEDNNLISTIASETDSSVSSILSQPSNIIFHS